MITGSPGLGAAAKPGCDPLPAAEFGFLGSGLNDDPVGNRWREIFPLPHALPPDRVSGLSTSSRRRKARVRSLVEEPNDVINCLNKMYGPSVQHTGLPPTESQRAY